MVCFSTLGVVLGQLVVSGGRAAVIFQSLLYFISGQWYLVGRMMRMLLVGIIRTVYNPGVEMIISSRSWGR